MVSNKLMIPAVSLPALCFPSSSVSPLNLPWLLRIAGEQHHSLEVTGGGKHLKTEILGLELSENSCEALKLTNTRKRLFSTFFLRKKDTEI